MYEAYLQHYGVKGMKWGVRRARSLARKLCLKHIMLGTGKSTMPVVDLVIITDD